MRILWMSDGPEAPTGYGNVTAAVCRGLAAAGHRVAILCRPSVVKEVANESLLRPAEGQPIPRVEEPTRWDGCELYALPAREKLPRKREYIVEVSRCVRPDVFIALTDLSMSKLPVRLLTTARIAMGIPWIAYQPIGGDIGDGSLPPASIDLLQGVDLSIAMSEYGRRVCEANGVRAAMIPNGVDVRTFTPPADKDAAKRAMGWEGQFVVLCDARNYLRKMLPRTLECFRRFAAGKPDVLLHLHCDPDDPWSRLWKYHYDLRADIELLGLTGRVRLTPGFSMKDGGLSLAQLAAFYQGADVHLLTSMSEGFGLPTLQAAASGVVPMAGAHTANTELVTGHGEALRIRRFLRDDCGVQQGLVDIDDAVRALNRLYDDRALLRAKARASRQFAEAYAWDRIVAKWDALLTAEVPRLRMRTPPDPALGATAAAADAPTGFITIPVTLPPARDGAAARETGRIYVAGRADLAVLGRLARVFPGITAWSTQDVHETIARIEPASPAFRDRLDTSTLALDVDGVVADLAVRAAAAGVPCVARRRASQVSLWPALAVESADDTTAARLGRWMLTDPVDAADVCAEARRQLAVQPAIAG